MIRDTRILDMFKEDRENGKHTSLLGYFVDWSEEEEESDKVTIEDFEEAFRMDFDQWIEMIREAGGDDIADSILEMFEEKEGDPE